MKRIKTVIIGAGYRGIGLLRLLLQLDQFEVTGVFDPSAPRPDEGEFTYYADGTDDYRRMIIEEEPELTVIASPWQCHVEQAYFALMQGSHVAIEIKGGFFLGEYQPLIDLAEKKDLRIFPLENAVFMRENMAMMNVVRAGVLGELVSIKGGYRHDLRDLLVDENGNLGNPNKPEGVWRSQFYVNENADLYPTHGIAPVYLAARIGRTDEITELTSFASKARGLQQRITERGGDQEINISTGDIVVTQLKTKNGLLITLTHDTTLPRPKSLDFELQGTKGIYKVRDRVPSYYGENCDIQNCILADGCVLEGAAQDSVLFRSVSIGKGAEVKHCVLMNDAKIGEGASLEYVILDKNVTIRAGAKLIGTAKNPIIIKGGEVV